MEDHVSHDCSLSSSEWTLVDSILLVCLVILEFVRQFAGVVSNNELVDKFAEFIDTISFPLITVSKYEKSAAQNWQQCEILIKNVPVVKLWFSSYIKKSRLKTFRSEESKVEKRSFKAKIVTRSLLPF